MKSKLILSLFFLVLFLGMVKPASAKLSLEISDQVQSTNHTLNEESSESETNQSSTTNPIFNSWIVNADRANNCSSHCQNYPRVKSLDMVPGCVSNKFKRPNDMIMTSRNTIECLVNLACYLERSPTLIEFMEGMAKPKLSQGAFSHMVCLGESKSSQLLPPLVEFKERSQPQAFRCLLGLYDGYEHTYMTGGSVWCGFTTLSSKVECAAQQTPRSCGTNPLSFDPTQTCDKINKITDLEQFTKDEINPSKPDSKLNLAFYSKTIASTTAPEKGSCIKCHEAVDVKPPETSPKTSNEKQPVQWYRFAFHKSIPLDPRENFQALCNYKHEALCPDGSRPTCSELDAIPTCSEGEASCAANKDAVAECQYPLMNAVATHNNFCEKSKELIEYLATLQGDPGKVANSLPFVTEWRKRYCDQ